MSRPIENLSKSNASSQLLVIKKPNKNFWKIPTTLPSKKRTLDRQNIIFSAGNQRTKDEQDVEDTESDEVIEGEVGDTTDEITEGTTEETTEELIEETTTEEATEAVTEEVAEGPTEEVTEDETTQLSRKKRQVSIELEPIEIYLENDEVALFSRYHFIILILSRNNKKQIFSYRYVQVVAQPIRTLWLTWLWTRLIYLVSLTQRKIFYYQYKL